MAVVDLLEVVQVEHDERDLAAVAVHAAQLDLERLAEELRPVEAGQRIDERPVLEPAPVAGRERGGHGGGSAGRQQHDAQRERHRQRRRERREQQPGGPRRRGEDHGGSEQDGGEWGEDERRQGAAQCESQCGGEGEPVAAQPSVEHRW